MYSPKIISRSQRNLEKKLKISLDRYSVDEVESWVDHLNTLRTAEGTMKRPLKPEEAAFVRNEILLSSIDFLYWAERYAWIIFDPDLGRGVGLKRFTPTQGQEHILRDIGRWEEEQTEATEREETVDGILIACHKTRQHGITMLARILIIHRLILKTHIRGISGSIDDEKVEKLYERDLRLLANLPWWMRPHEGFHEKAQHITWDKLDTSLLYQTLVQKAGIGQGEQYDIGHFTEVASVPYFEISLANDYLPTIPRSVTSLHILETTPQGRNNWWRGFVENLRKGGTRWRLSILPWYVGLAKYRKTPPLDWKPSEVAMLHAQKVYETSPDYLGKQIMLPKENLYWWESTREEARRNDDLVYFYTNYWATIDESFQYTTRTAFDSDTLERFRLRTTIPSAYDIMGSPL